MLTVHSNERSERNTLASVAIVNRDCECVYEAFVQQPRSRNRCPVTDQQFDVARYTPGTSFDDVRREVLAILDEYYQSAISNYRKSSNYSAKINNSRHDV